MKPFDKLEIQELIDLLNQYSSKYSQLKKEMRSDEELLRCKLAVEQLSNEIDKRKRSTIGPYNTISDHRDDQKTA